MQATFVRQSVPDALLPVLVDKVVVVHHCLVEGQVEKVEDDAQPPAGMEHQLLVVDDHAASRPDLVALLVHRLDDGVPPLETLTRIVEIVTRDRHLIKDRHLIRDHRLIKDRYLIKDRHLIKCQRTVIK